MLTLDEATVEANSYLRNSKVFPSIELLLLQNKTIEFEYGWVFFYQSKEYIETGNIFYALGGNAPIIINKFNGSIRVTGTGETIEKYIEEYIKNHKR